MAQRMESFKDHLRPVLTVGATRAQNECKPHPSHKRGSPHRHRAPLKSCEKTQGFVRFPTPKHHLDKALRPAAGEREKHMGRRSQCANAITRDNGTWLPFGFGPNPNEINATGNLNIDSTWSTSDFGLKLVERF